MKALLQRVSHAHVSVEEEEVGKIGPGLVVLLGVEEGDSESDAKYLAEKIAGLRIFEDEDSKFNLSIKDTGGQILVISQFTLMADTRKGRRPSFTSAAPPDLAEELLEYFVQLLRQNDIVIETGQFQKHMIVDIHNDGPVTIPLDSKDRHKPRK